MGEKTRVTVRPSRSRLWNVPITFELLTFLPSRSVQCPQSPSLRPRRPSVQRHLELLLSPSPARAAIGCDGRVVVAPVAAHGWSGNRLSAAIVTSFRSPSRVRERAALDWSSPPIRICGRSLLSPLSSSLFGAGDDLARSVVVGPKVADAGRSHHRRHCAAEQCQNRDGCRVSATGRAGFGGLLIRR